MKILLVTRGVPGCGKSTWIKDNGFEKYTLSPDTIRLMFSSPKMNVDGTMSIPSDNDKRVWDLFQTILEFRMASGDFTVVDATHTKLFYYKDYKKLCEKFGYELVVADFSEIDLETVLKRNIGREQYKQVPKDVIVKMYESMKQTKLDGYNVIPYEDVMEYLYSKDNPIDVNEYNKIVVFGDIHSCYEPLKEYFDKEPFSKDNLYIFCGDYFDRGIQAKEVLQFLLDMVEQPNVVLLKGNHEIWVDNYVKSGLDAYLSPAFVKSLEDMGELKENLTKISKKLVDKFYLTFDNKNIIVTHGGTPRIPLVDVKSIQNIKGVGSYNDCDLVDEYFNNSTIDVAYSIHGHRNINNVPIQNGRTFNLEGKVELGGYLRIVELTKDGFNPLYIKNDVYDKELEQKHFKLKGDYDVKRT